MIGIISIQGPCVSTDTACSSSLVAAHLAAQGLQAAAGSSGSSGGAALAGGVNVMLLAQTTARICLLQVCKRFDWHRQSQTN